MKRTNRLLRYGLSLLTAGAALHGVTTSVQAADIVARLTPALRLDDVVLGGGKAQNLEKLPKGCRAGANAFVGGFLLWKKKGK